MYEEIFSRIKGLQKTEGVGWSALCPAHDDRHRSLTLRIGKNGDLLVRCHSAKCSFQQIAEALACRREEFFADYHEKGREKKPDIEAVYAYGDEHGELLYESVRCRGKHFFQRRYLEDGRIAMGLVEEWYAPVGQGKHLRQSRQDAPGSIRLPPVRLVPYHLDELTQAAPERPVEVVEGEKCCDYFRDLGCLATTNAAGAEKWEPSFAEFFQGRSVRVWPDQDERGWKHAALVCESLAPAAAIIRVVDLPGRRLTEGPDDWLCRQRCDRSRKRALIELHALAAPVWDGTAHQVEMAQLRCQVTRALVAGRCV